MNYDRYWSNTYAMLGASSGAERAVERALAAQSAPPPRNAMCESCGHGVAFQPIDPNGDQPVQVQCRRYPPRPSGSGPVFPILHAYDWCGEWTPIPDDDKDGYL